MRWFDVTRPLKRPQWTRRMRSSTWRRRMLRLGDGRPRRGAETTAGCFIRRGGAREQPFGDMRPRYTRAVNGTTWRFGEPPDPTWPLCGIRAKVAAWGGDAGNAPIRPRFCFQIGSNSRKSTPMYRPARSVQLVGILRRYVFVGVLCVFDLPLLVRRSGHSITLSTTPRR